MNKPKTNRDVVNAMTDEELVEFAFGRGDVGNKYCRVHWQDSKPCRYDLNCSICMLAWLKAPAGKHQEVAKNAETESV